MPATRSASLSVFVCNLAVGLWVGYLELLNKLTWLNHLYQETFVYFGYFIKSVRSGGRDLISSTGMFVLFLQSEIHDQQFDQTA